MDYQYRSRWTTLIAATYLILCSANVLYLVSAYLRPGFIFSPRDIFPLAAAVFAWLYFLAPKWGHRGLIGLTIVVIFAIGEFDPSATIFHLVVLGLLALPFFTAQSPDICSSSTAAQSA
jgi:hypothetical protein